jgi:hypothetical protein
MFIQSLLECLASSDESFDTFFILEPLYRFVFKTL